MAGYPVTGDQYRIIDRRMREIKRQLDVAHGSPLDPQKVMDGLQRIVEGNFDAVPRGVFNVWRAVRLGTYATTDELAAAIEAKGGKINDWARNILKKVILATEPSEINLVVRSIAELGLKDGATTKEIHDAASRHGLSLCPAEVGPQLRLQYDNQPGGEWLRVAMDPIVGSDGGLNVFSVAHDVSLWLSTGLGHPGSQWGADDRWVFSLSKRYP